MGGENPNALPDAVELDARVTLAVLRQLVALQRLGSISAVARDLGVSQPTVSMNLSRLEDALGVSIILRSARGSTLTSAGEAIATAATPLVESARELAQRISCLPSLTKTPLRIAASLTIAEHLVPRWLADRRIAGVIPPAAATLCVGNSSEVMNWLHDGRADIGFVEGNRIAHGLDSALVGEDELVAVVSQSHPWRSWAEVRGSELAQSGLVLRERGSGTREVMEAAFARAKISLPTTLPSFGSTAAILTAVRYGGAVAVVSSLAIADEVAARELVALRVSDVDLRRRLSAVWSRGASPRPDAAAVVANLVAAHRRSTD